MQWIQTKLHPNRVLKWINASFKWLTIGTSVLLIAALYSALINSPADYQQGDAVRMMYIHVPAAWMALGLYIMVAMMSISGLVWKHPVSFMIASSTAPIGACFALICLITGSIWGKPIWGTWWVWDARLTSMLILFFFYIGYIILYRAFDETQRAEKTAGLLSIVGLINVPIVKFSVDWWNTLHQPASILRREGIAIDPSMLTPLFMMFASLIGIFLIILSLRLKQQILMKKMTRMHMMRTR